MTKQMKRYDTASSALKIQVDVADVEEQDIGVWEETLDPEIRSLVKKFDLSKKVVWNFGITKVLGPDDIKAIGSALQKCPKEKIVKKIVVNLASADIKIR